MKLYSFVSQNHHVRFHILRWQISCIFFLPAVRLKWGPLNICLVIDLLDLPHGVRCTAAALDRQPSKTRVHGNLNPSVTNLGTRHVDRNMWLFTCWNHDPQLGCLWLWMRGLVAKQDVALTMSHSRQQPFRHFLYLCTTCFPEGQTVNLEAMLAWLVSTSRMMETGYDKQELIWESDRMRYEERWVSKSGCDGRVCLLALWLWSWMGRGVKKHHEFWMVDCDVEFNRIVKDTLWFCVLTVKITNLCLFSHLG